MAKEKKIKEPKAQKQPKATKIKKEKKSKYPEWYIGRPKPMKTNTFEFHKPGKKFYVWLTFWLLVLGFITYIVIRLVNVGKTVQPMFEFYSFDSENTKPSYVLENDSIKFELDSATTQFTVTQKDTGKVWYSSPKDLNQDQRALPKEKNNMRSPFIIKYSTETGIDNIFDFYTNSITTQFYEIKAKNDEITVNYTIGDIEREYIIPLAIYQDELDKWTSKLTKSEKKKVLLAYHKYNKSLLKDENEYQAYLSKYPDMDKQNLYLIFDDVQEYLKADAETLFAKVGYGYDDYQKNKAMYKEENIKETPAFNLSVTYKLDGNSLNVSIPFESISYRNIYPITELSILPYFGAGGLSDEGFLFVPEGSGSIIDFNNGKTKQSSYYADIYGWDWGTDRKAIITETKCTFPVFGISNGDSSFISIIKDGAEYAGVKGEISGKLGSYNYACAEYKMLHREQFDITTRNITAQYAYEQGLPKDEKIEQIYTFVSSPSYVEMAKAYRDYLFKDAQKLSQNDNPVVVEIVGAIDKVQQIAGIPKVKPYVLTDYAQAAQIIKRIDELGIKDAEIKLTGFINDSIRQSLMKKIKFISELGGKKGFNAFLNEVSGTSAKLYLDGAVQTAYRTSFFKGFNKYKHAARFVSDELCELNEYSPIWYGKLKEKDSYYLVNQNLVKRGCEKLISTGKKYNLAGISFRDNGDTLSSDFNKHNFSSRNKSKSLQIQEFANTKNQKLGLIVNAGNDYTIPYSDNITNMVLHGYSYAILDKMVPFYQIALHGYKNYASKPINIAYNKEQILLESAEAGAGLYFTFIAEDETKLQETDFSQYFSTTFSKHEEEFVDLCKKYNSQISKVSGALIDDHKYLSSEVTWTAYDNGYVVIVNFGYEDYTTEYGMKIPARQFVVTKR